MATQGMPGQLVNLDNLRKETLNVKASKIKPQNRFSLTLKLALNQDPRDKDECACVI